MPARITASAIGLLALGILAACLQMEPADSVTGEGSDISEPGSTSSGGGIDPRAIHADASRAYVQRCAEPPALDGNWDGPLWSQVQALSLDHWIGPRPEHFPKTEARALYDAEAIYLIFRVEDRYVRARARRINGRVWEDSCVEFFFTPGEDPARGYFNLEVNCGGTILFSHQFDPRRGTFPSIDECRMIGVKASMDPIVDPEIAGPVTWTVELRIPLELLARYCEVTPPAPGVVWRGNFHKCADASSHPHWLTWSPIHSDDPDFHRPQDFGVLEFR